MKVGVLDLGTNTFHLVIGEKNDGEIEVLHRESVFVKIGQGGINAGLITEEALQRAENALAQFHRTTEKMKVFKVVGTATSAIRSAKNGQAFLDKMKQQFGFNIKAISGEEEALLIYEGIKSSLFIGEIHSLMMDIGGGSVEFIIGNQHEVFWKQSFEIGAQRMYDLFHKSEPIEKSELQAQHTYLTQKLTPLLNALEQHAVQVLIGSAGTFKTLADMHRATQGKSSTAEFSEHTLSKNDFYEILPSVIEKDREYRLNIPGMKAERVDMIVVAFSLIDFILKNTPQVYTIRVSRGSLREGLLNRTLAEGNL